MSLKARIEAVIYAAEEPVTLAQLASLFREEAAEVRAARLAATPAESAKREAPITEGAVPEPGVAEPPLEPARAASPSEPEVLEPAAPVDPEEPERDAGLAELEAPADPETAAREAQSAQRAVERAVHREIRDELRRLVDELIADYAAADRGIEIREVAGGFRMATRAEYHDAVRAFVKSLKPPMKLSLQALETLAVIAYKQPVTAPEIGEIRGVDSGGVLGSLVARKLITTAGRKQVIGRPILYKTTREFLLRFGLKDLNELPSIEEFEKMAADLEESEAESTIATPEEELPFAQNEIAEVEEAAESESGPAAIGEPSTDPGHASATEHDATTRPR